MVVLERPHFFIPFLLVLTSLGLWLDSLGGLGWQVALSAVAWAVLIAACVPLAPLVREAAGNGARLVVLSEMFSTGFVVDRDDIGEEVGGPSSAFLSSMATELGGSQERC